MSTFVLIVIVLVASTLQAGTGFGFSIMATPLLLLLFSPHDAIQINIVLSLLISLIVAFKIRNQVDKEILKRLIEGSIIGILPGVLLFVFLDVRPLKILVCILILASTSLIVLKVNFQQTKFKDLMTGAISGLLTTSLGMPGPPLLIYFAGAKVDKATLRSTSLAYFVFIYSISFLLQFLMYSTSHGVLIATLWGFPFALLGIYLGQKMFARLKQQLFQKIIYALLFVTGICLLFTTLY